MLYGIVLTSMMYEEKFDFNYILVKYFDCHFHSRIKLLRMANAMLKYILQIISLKIWNTNKIFHNFSYY
jgi:hypothetical protein